MIVTIRGEGETDDRLHPAPGEGKNALLLSDSDGSHVLTFPARGLTLSERIGSTTDEVLKLQDVKITAYVTDTRVAFACSNYDKGGGWIGGLGAVALNAGSKLAAAMRSRGQVLTGQIRYPWLGAVGGHTKAGWLDDESMLLTTTFRRDGTTIRLRLEFSLPKDVDSTEIAREIARRAARYRLSAGDGQENEKERQGLEQLAEASKLKSSKGEYALHTFPTNWHVSPGTADLAAFLRSQAMKPDA